LPDSGTSTSSQLLVANRLPIALYFY
jgi:hypothetical protein